MDDVTRNAIEIGRRHARDVLAFRAKAQETRARALDAHKRVLHVRTEAIRADGVSLAAPIVMKSAGVLVAEGDSWFDYPFYDVLEELEDRHGYDVESVAHHGDAIEEMAYGGNQLEELTRRIEKLLARSVTPKAVLLSGGGNDVAGPEFGMLLNHAHSAIAGLNASILDGVIDQRIRTAYVTILSAVTDICEQKLGRALPILAHGYDYPIPDGRGFLGGWGPLPGPWLEPGFREKGYITLPPRIPLAHQLIERFNTMLEGVVALPPFAHVQYVNLRNTFPAGGNYKDWWGNELHPTEAGFARVAERFADVLATLP